MGEFSEHETTCRRHRAGSCHCHQLKVEDLWQRILAGESGVHPVRLFDVSDLKVKIGGDIYDWDPSEYIDSKDVKRVDRFTQFAIVAGTDAVRDSGLDLAQEDSYRCGVILGSGIGGLGEIEVQMSRLMTKGPDRVSAFTVPKMMLNAAGSVLSIEFGIRGPNYAVATACASATNAMADALKLIQDGGADVVITGGTEAAMTRMGLAAFQNIKALSMRNDDPMGASRPFDADRDGFVFSEGAGLLVFEELEHARARGARIYGEVLWCRSQLGCRSHHAARRAWDRRSAGHVKRSARRWTASRRYRLYQRSRNQHASGG